MPLIEPGARAPSFRLGDQGGAIHSLSMYKGHPLVLYFYPKDDTTGCTAEACAFRDLLPSFGKLGIPVLGISPDDELSHARFAGKHRLTFPLLADVRGRDGTPRTCDAYGVWQEKSMYGRKYMGVQRTTYLIGPTGRVLQRWDRVKVPGHADEVLAAAARLGLAGGGPRGSSPRTPRPGTLGRSRAG